MPHDMVVSWWMVLGEVIPEVHVSWIPFDIKIFLLNSIMYPIEAHVHGFGKFCLMFPFIVPYYVEMYVIISVAGCGWPISIRVVLSASNSL